VACARLRQIGAVDIDEPVASHVPAFAVNGKGQVTLRHVLTHTTGIEDDPACVLDQGASWAATLDRACAAVVRPDAVGTVAAYSARTGWFLLAEVLGRASGLAPIEVDDRLGMRAVGVAGATIATDERSYRPGRSTTGPLDELVRLCSALSPTNRLVDDHLDEATRREVVRPWRQGMVDAVHRSDSSWGLGVAVDGRLFGTALSPLTFGHLGAPGTFVLFEPERGLAVAAHLVGVRREMHATAGRYLLTAGICRDVD